MRKIRYINQLRIGARLGASLLTLCAALSTSTPTLAATQDALGISTMAFRGSETSLQKALKEFTARTGYSLVYSSKKIRGKRAPKMDGDYVPEEALRLMLDGSGLRLKKINATTWALVEREQLKPVEPVLIDRDIRYLLGNHPRDEILVKATYKHPTGLAGVRSLYTISGDALRFGGVNNVAEPLSDLPSNLASVSSANTALLPGSEGLNLADMRGLGPERTLVLVNGRRFVRTNGGNGSIFGVDLNAIPAAFVERIEIVNQGAGASLGGDAVAGSINFVLRDDVQGLIVSADGGISGRGDAKEYSISILGGAGFAQESGHISLGVTYVSEPSLLAQDRIETASPYGFAVDGVASFAPGAVFLPGFGGSSFTPKGTISGGVTTGGQVAFFADQSERLALSADGSSFAPFIPTLDNLYNWAQDFSNLPEIDRIIVYSSLKYEFDENTHAFLEGHFARSKIRSQIGAVPLAFSQGRDPKFGDAIVVSADNPFAPAGLRTEVEAALGQPIDAFILERRFTELGPRVARVQRNTLQLTGGVSGAITQNIRYDILYQFGLTNIDERKSGLLDSEQLSTALDPALCAATAVCTPINIFGEGHITRDQTNFVAANRQTRLLNSREHVAQAKISAIPYSIESTEGQVSVGIEFRKTRFEDERLTDFETTPIIGTFLFPGAAGSLNAFDFFFDFTAPIFADKPLANRVEFGGAARLTSHSTVGEFTNISGNFLWSPVPGLELYAHAQHGGRAPNTAELFGTGPALQSLFFDPCSAADPGKTPTLAENCGASGPLGVPDGFIQSQFVTSLQSFGSEALLEENIDNRVFGAALDFTSLGINVDGDATISADWRRYNIDGFISSPSEHSILAACYHSEGLSSIFCGNRPGTNDPFIVRDIVSREITAINSTRFNSGSFRTKSLDIHATYIADIEDPWLIDGIGFDILYTYTHKVEERLTPGAAYTNLTGLAAFPRHQVNADMLISMGPVKSTLSVRRRGQAYSTQFREIPEAHITAKVYVDLSMRYEIGDSAIIYGGIENLTDTKPPIVAFSTGNVFREYYDTIGRRFFAGVTLEF